MFSPVMDREFPYPSGMAGRLSQKDEESTASDTAKVLAENLNALMAFHPNLNSNPKLAKKMEVSTATISRLRNAEVDANLSTVELIAKAFDVDVWQLFVARMDPANRPALRPYTEQERKLYEQFRELAKGIKEGG
jgi:transcriptional regulator with XRE-family HTH domain